MRPYRIARGGRPRPDGLSRRAQGRAIDVPAVDFGGAQLVLLPAETVVQYQLWAQDETGLVCGDSGLRRMCARVYPDGPGGE
jgi:hypothetical protein